jgi:hypothetical protein
VGGNRDRWRNVKPGMDDEERQALRAEGFDPDDPAVVAANRAADATYLASASNRLHSAIAVSKAATTCALGFGPARLSFHVLIA